MEMEVRQLMLIHMSKLDFYVANVLSSVIEIFHAMVRKNIKMAQNTSTNPFQADKEDVFSLVQGKWHEYCYSGVSEMCKIKFMDKSWNNCCNLVYFFSPKHQVISHNFLISTILLPLNLQFYYYYCTSDTFISCSRGERDEDEDKKLCSNRFCFIDCSAMKE